MHVLASKNDSKRSLPNPGNLESLKKHRLSVDFRSQEESSERATKKNQVVLDSRILRK